MNSDLDYCRAMAAQKDHGGYLVSLMMPRKVREGIWPVLALRAVLSDIHKTVSDPTLGYIRLAWWRQEIEVLGAKAQSDPVLRALADMAKARGIIPADFTEFLNGFDATMDGDPPPDAPFAALMARVTGRYFARWQKVDAERARTIARYKGTAWQDEPPFFALRLFAVSVL